MGVSARPGAPKRNLDGDFPMKAPKIEVTIAVNGHLLTVTYPAEGKMGDRVEQRVFLAAQGLFDYLEALFLEVEQKGLDIPEE